MLGPATVEIISLTREPGEIVEAAGRQRPAQAPFADEAGPISRLAEQHRIRVGQQSGRQRLHPGQHAVGSRVKPGEDAGPAGHADGGGDKGIGEPHAAGGQGVDVRRLQNRVAGAAHRIPALVVGDENDEVWPAERSPAGRGRNRGAARPRRRQRRQPDRRSKATLDESPSAQSMCRPGNVGHGF